MKTILIDTNPSLFNQKIYDFDIEELVAIDEETFQGKIILDRNWAEPLSLKGRFDRYQFEDRFGFILKGIAS